MDFGLYAGDTSKTIYVWLRDSTTGLEKTGLVFNSAGAVGSYTLPLAARAAITLATQTVTGAWSSGGFVEVDATNAKGLYRLDLPNAAIASGDYSIISIQFTGTITETVLIPLHVRKVNATQIAGEAVSTTTAQIGVNVVQVSADATAADNLEALLDGTGGVTLVASAFTLTTPITANATQLSGDATAADNAESFFDGTGYAGTGNTIPTVTTLTNLPAITANWLTATGINTGAITSAKFAAGAIDAAAIATNAIDADSLAADAVTEIWNKAMTELSAVPGVTGTVLEALQWLFLLSRNRITQTATTQIVKKDDESTTLATSTVSDDGTTFTRGEFA